MRFFHTFSYLGRFADWHRLASVGFVGSGTFDGYILAFPRSLAQILQQSDEGAASEAHLGRMDVWDGRAAGGTGVELWAWWKKKVSWETSDFPQNKVDEFARADARWATLNNALPGLFAHLLIH